MLDGKEPNPGSCLPTSQQEQAEGNLQEKKNASWEHGGGGVLGQGPCSYGGRHKEKCWEGQGPHTSRQTRQGRSALFPCWRGRAPNANEAKHVLCISLSVRLGRLALRLQKNGARPNPRQDLHHRCHQAGGCQAGRTHTTASHWGKREFRVVQQLLWPCAACPNLACHSSKKKSETPISLP